MLKKLRARLQSLKTEREEAKHREEMALRGKDAVRCQAFVPGCESFLPQGSCRNSNSLDTEMGGLRIACPGEQRIKLTM